MAHITADRVKETTTTTGTGNVTLAGASTGFRAFSSVMADSDTCFYAIQLQAGSEWEVGYGTFVSATPALARTTVLASSNAGAAVSFSAGTKDVFITIPAQATGHGTLTPAQITATQNDYNPTGLAFANILRLDVDQARRVTGLSGGVSGRRIEIENISAGTDGDLILNFEDSASTAANRFAFDNDLVVEPGEGCVLTYDGVSSRWRCSSIRRKYTGSTFRLTPFIWTDFHGGATADTGEASYAVWDLAVISSGTQAKVAGTANHPGILQVSSSTTTNSGAYIRTEATALIFGGGEVAEFVFRIPNLTTTTIRMGFIDTATSADCVDGAYIEIPSTGDAVGKTSNNSTRTTSATITTLSTNTWYRARIAVNRAATAVDFYIYDDNGNQLGTVQNAANIPTAAGREFGHGIIGTKSGTTAQAIFQIDYMSIEWTRALV